MNTRQTSLAIAPVSRRGARRARVAWSAGLGWAHVVPRPLAPEAWGTEARAAACHRGRSRARDRGWRLASRKPSFL